MPISACDSCTEQHWSEVKAIITDAVEAVGFTASLVSDADDVGIIQKRIIQNLFDNPIVVCDVSAKNPNVMFELGMRLAFDKPTIIVKDDKTTYSFDTSPIEHLDYPRDLRFSKIVDFKKNLGEKIVATVSRSEKDPNYTTFLKHFGKFAVASLETTEVSKEDYIIEELKELRKQILRRDVIAERELMRMMDRGMAISRRDTSSSDSARRKRLTAFVENYVNEFLAGIPGRENAVAIAELDINLVRKLLENPEIRQLAESPAEVEELVHRSIRRQVG